MPNTVFILAAGKGTRLRPHTDTTPKPMVTVWEKPIIEHTIEKCKKDGIKNIIINLNHLGDIIKNYFSSNKDIIFSEEKDLLETGGGLKFAKDHIKEEALFMINGDAFWTEGRNQTALERMKTAWNPDKMDILLLLQPVSQMSVTGGVGDYDIDKNSHAIRSLDKTGKYMFTGIRITKKNVVDIIDKDNFSFLECMDTAQKQNKLYGLIHQGIWHHISTPEDLENVNALNEANA